MTLTVREAKAADREAVAALLLPVMRAGQTYPLPRDWDAERIAGYWFADDKTVYVAHDEGGALAGTYYLRANQPGAGSHVANAGYVVADGASGRGVGAALCEHSLDRAGSAGYRAMQFNLVVSTNDRAVRLWRRMGFAVVGTLPVAFRHPSRGLVDAYVMHRAL